MQSIQTLDIAAEIGETTFRLLTNCQQKEQRLAQQFRVTVPEFKTLRMFHASDTMHIKQLIEKLALSGSRLTRILDSLEEQGYITRSIDPDNRRSILVTLTPRGRAFVSQLQERYVEMHRQILEGIPEEFHAVVVTGLQRLLASLEEWLHNSEVRHDPVPSEDENPVNRGVHS
jgi:DNA-binding MarR family transcriptional regulator